jgi:hypothetical protein
MHVHALQAVHKLSCEVGTSGHYRNMQLWSSSPHHNDAPPL